MPKSRRALSFLFVGSLLAAAIAYGCSDDQQAAPPEPDAGNPNRARPDTDSGGGKDGATDAPSVTYKAAASLQPTGLTDAGSVTGSVSFEQTNGSIKVAITVSGATPGDHGVHIHDGTSCDATDAGPAMAAGGHWNPADAGHGLPTSPTHHPGDFGNVTIGADGTGTLTLPAVTGFTVAADGGALSAIGHALIFHQGTDDGTPPVGNAGGRAGCGIIVAQ